MGMFDTISLDPPVICPSCGKLHHETQTKHFSNVLFLWKTGDLLRDCPITSGVLKETVYCCRDDESNQRATIEIYLVVWHGIYAGYGLSEADADGLLSRIDRLDLITWLDRAQQEAREWRARYQSLRSDVKEWAEELKNPRAQRPERERLFGAWNALPDEILSDPDPLARILERNAETSPVRRAIFGF